MSESNDDIEREIKVRVVANYVYSVIFAVNEIEYNGTKTFSVALGQDLLRAIHYFLGIGGYSWGTAKGISNLNYGSVAYNYLGIGWGDSRTEVAVKSLITNLHQTVKAVTAHTYVEARNALLWDFKDVYYDQWGLPTEHAQDRLARAVSQLESVDARIEAGANQVDRILWV